MARCKDTSFSTLRFLVGICQTLTQYPWPVSHLHGRLRSSLASKMLSTLTTVVPLERMKWLYMSIVLPLIVLVLSHRHAQLDNRTFLRPRTSKQTHCANFHLRGPPSLGFLHNTILQLRGCAQHRPVSVSQLKPTMTPLTSH